MIDSIKKLVKEKFPSADIDLSVDDRHIVTVSGSCRNWNDVVGIGHLIGEQSDVKNVVNDLSVPGLDIPKKDYSADRKSGLAIGKIADVDIIIIGAGITGCGIARELSKYDLDIIVIDMGDDVCTGASKANNGDIHPGHAVKPGTLKAKLNVRGNKLYDIWAEELNFKFIRCGSLMAIDDESLMPGLEYYYKTGKANGVAGIELVDGDRAIEIEPVLADQETKPIAALWLPTMGIVDPYEVVIALAENAASNGVKFMLNCTVADILHENGEVRGVITSKGVIKSKYVINCAGIYADEISAMAGDRSYTIHGRRGAIAIIDKRVKPMFSGLSGLFSGKQVQKKDSHSKGGGMCLTPEGNILLGPSATEIPDKEDNSVTEVGLSYAMNLNYNPDVNYSTIIRFFSGVRPPDYKEDFVIEMSPITHGFVNVGGIQSPGLASSPAIAEMVEQILCDDFENNKISLNLKKDFEPYRKESVAFRHLSRREQGELIKTNPKYGRIVCRCESVTEGEILDAINSPIVPTSIDAIKRRTRAGMGRCQGGFCQPRVIELLARELGKEWVEINLNMDGTNILVQPNRSMNIKGKAGIE